MTGTHDGESVRPTEGEVWHRTEDGRAPVRIGRVWRGAAFGGIEDDYIRCEPLRGGRVWFTNLTEFCKRYEPSDGGAMCDCPVYEASPHLNSVPVYREVPKGVPRPNPKPRPDRPYA